MKIVLTSDTHLGITGKGQIKNLFKDIAKESPDLIIHAGDYSGNMKGAGAVGLTCAALRKFNPDVPVVSVIGNHDFWSGWKCGGGDYVVNYDKILKAFKDHNVHFLDESGSFVLEDIEIIGASGWYTNPQPPTNDANFLPVGLEGDTNRSLLRRSTQIILKQIEAADPTKLIIVTTHFGLIKSGDDWKGGFEAFSWNDQAMVRYIQEKFPRVIFINGHAHQLHEGPLKYECGSDYKKPNYITIDTKEILTNESNT